jgi:hypothetical protein
MKILELESQPRLMRCPRCKGVIDSQSRECRFCHRTLSPGDARTAAELYLEDQDRKAGENNRRTLKYSIVALISTLALVLLKFLETFLPPLLKKNNIELSLAILLALSSLGFWLHRKLRNRDSVAVPGTDPPVLSPIYKDRRSDL